MKTSRQLILGKTLVMAGCLWFVLVLFRIRPLFLLAFFLLAQLKHPVALDAVLTILFSGEYIASLAAVLLGAMVWRHAQVNKWPIKAVFVILAILSLALVGVGIRREVKYLTRQASYQTTLRSYTAVLKPGMTRKEVENYLRARKTTFTEICCVEVAKLGDRSSMDDLIKIGNEAAPWFCSEKTVCIAFQFNDYARRDEGQVAWKDNDLDTLKSVTIWPQFGGCL